ncbi:hypothetical protein EB796_012618 [Bugula neritina]|uniref:Uncharacterized protein n=1 Tax=Bugula neritina TaxID=10212 RepID=A0A7J7JUL9_BUGNE|nr:hypothetical protein EB796_012618 [Bugula neritina]
MAAVHIMFTAAFMALSVVEFLVRSKEECEKSCPPSINTTPLLSKRKHANSHWKQDNVEHYSPDGEVKMEHAENLYMEDVEGMAITSKSLYMEDVEGMAITSSELSCYIFYSLEN